MSAAAASAPGPVRDEGGQGGMAQATSSASFTARRHPPAGSALSTAQPRPAGSSAAAGDLSAATSAHSAPLPAYAYVRDVTLSSTRTIVSVHGLADRELWLLASQLSPHPDAVAEYLRLVEQFQLHFSKAVLTCLKDVFTGDESRTPLFRLLSARQRGPEVDRLGQAVRYQRGGSTASHTATALFDFDTLVVLNPDVPIYVRGPPAGAAASARPGAEVRYGCDRGGQLPVEPVSFTQLAVAFNDAVAQWQQSHGRQAGMEAEPWSSLDGFTLRHSERSRWALCGLECDFLPAVESNDGVFYVLSADPNSAPVESDALLGQLRITQVDDSYQGARAMMKAMKVLAKDMHRRLNIASDCRLPSSGVETVVIRSAQQMGVRSWRSPSASFVDIFRACVTELLRCLEDDAPLPPPNHSRDMLTQLRGRDEAATVARQSIVSELQQWLRIDAAQLQQRLERALSDMASLSAQPAAAVASSPVAATATAAASSASAAPLTAHGATASPASASASAAPLVFGVPRLQVNFVGQEQLIAQLRQHLHLDQPPSASEPSGVIVVASGLGGVGKTTLLAYLAPLPEVQRHFTLVAWLQADSRERLQQSLISLAAELDVPVDKPEQAATVVRHYLSMHSGWMLIFDNAELESGVDDVLPEHGGGMALLTSRTTAGWPTIWRDLPVPPMSEADCLALLRGYVGSSASDSELLPLIKRLGCLPLALAQAGAYMKRSDTMASEYLRCLQSDSAAQMLLRNSRWLPGSVVPVAVTFDRTLERIQQEDRHALPLLLFCACLSPDRIPRELLDAIMLARVTASQPGTAADAAVSWEIAEIATSNAHSTLHAYSLLSRESDQPTSAVYMHRLLADVLRFHHKQQLADYPPYDYAGWWSQLLSAQASYFDQFFNSVQGQQRDDIGRVLFPHCRLVLTHARAASPQTASTLEFADVLALAGAIECITLFDFPSYLHSFEEVLRIQEPLLPADDLKLAGTLAHLGQACRFMGQHQRAKALLQRAVALHEQRGDTDNTQYAARLGVLAGVHRSLGEYDLALAFQQRVLWIQEAKLGRDHADVGITLNNMAITCKSLGDLPRAKQLYDQALDIMERIYGDCHPEFGLVLGNLGELHCLLGDLSRARDMLERTLRIYSAALGETHALLRVPLRHLAAVMVEQREYAAALPLAEKAVQLVMCHFDADSVESAECFITQGDALRGLGQLEQSRSVLDRALKLKTQQYCQLEDSRSVVARVLELEADHVEIAYPLRSLGLTLSALRQHADAITHLERALRTVHQLPTPNVPLLCRVMVALGQVYEHSGQPVLRQPAEELLRYSLQLAAQCPSVGEQHPMAVEARALLAKLESRASASS